MKTLRIFGLVFGLVLLAMGNLLAQATSENVTLSIDRNKITDRNYHVTWRNGASEDTTIRRFTGSAVLKDTSREVFWIGGANTISLQTTYTILNDSAQVHMYLEISADGNSFQVVNASGTGGSQPQTAATGGAPALDSLGSADTGDSPYTRVVNIASPPTWARYCRAVARKALSASDDTVNVKSFLNVHWGDE